MFKKDQFTYFKFLPFILAVFILFKLVNNVEIITYTFNMFTKILYPFIWGFAIAFFINPFMTYIEQKFKLNRIISLSISYTFILVLIYFLFKVIYPSLIGTTSDIIERVPDFITRTQKYFDNVLLKSNFLGKDFLLSYINNVSTNLNKSFETHLDTYLSLAFNYILKLSYNIFQIIFGFIISVYMLKDKEKFKYRLIKIIAALFNTKTADLLIELGRESNAVFSKFFVGKIIDSTAVGILCFIVLISFNFQYALLISLIIGVTNMIPYFGPIFGIIPAVFITLFVDPVRAIWMGIFTFILLQFDAQYLGPKIISDKVGMSPFLVILALIIGGGLFGVLGIFLSVPTFSVIKTFFSRYIDAKLAEKESKKGLSHNA